jgi:hypothetical protein
MVQQFQQLLTVLGLTPGAGEGQWGDAGNTETSLNADIASNSAWNSSGAGDWSAR